MLSDFLSAIHFLLLYDGQFPAKLAGAYRFSACGGNLLGCGELLETEISSPADVQPDGVKPVEGLRGLHLFRAYSHR